MSLYKKILLIWAAMLVLLLITSLVLSKLLLINLLDQESNDINKDLKLVLNVFNSKNRELESIALDWAQWDESYQFVYDGNQDYIDSYMVDSTFSHLKVNVMLYLDPAGRTVLAKGFDLTRSRAAVPQDLIAELKNHPDIRRSDQKRDPLTGLLMLPGSAMIISSCPILRNDGQGQVGGTLLVGRYLDEGLIKEISQTTQAVIDVLNVNKIDDYPENKAASEALAPSRPVVVEPLSRDLAAGYTTIKDLYGNPALIVRITVVRNLYQQGLATVYYAGFFAIAAGLGIGIIILYLLQRMILSRIFRLSQEVKAISRKGFGIAVTRNSTDELGQLAEAINSMLIDLEEMSNDKKRILESVSDGFLSLDANLRCTYANRAAQGILAFKRTELVGRTLEEVLVHIDPYLLNKFQQSLSEKKPFQQELYFNVLHKWFEFSICPNENGFIVYLRDVSARKMHENASLRKSEELFFKAFHGNPIMMAILSLDEERFIDINEAMLTTLEFDRKDTIGHSILDLNILDDLEKVKKYERTLLKKWKIAHTEIQFYTRSGLLRHGLLWSYLFYQNDLPCHLVAVIDTTENRRMQDEFKRLDRLNLVGQIAASIAHEIRNPMTAVKGFIQMLDEQNRCKHDQVYLDLIIEELDRANTIIAEFLSIAQNKAINLELHSLDSIISALFPLIQADALYSSVEVALNLGNTPPILADEGEIRQMILNLARNGMEAMSSGGRLIIGTYFDSGDVVLYLQDEGGGIDSRILGRLGTPFLTTKEKGTGLGLAICYSIAARHQAQITVETGPEGTTFKVRFPRELTGTGKHIVE